MENSTASVMLATTKATFSFFSFTIAGMTDKYLNFYVFLWTGYLCTTFLRVLQ